MGEYEFLEHTADEKFRVTSPSLEDGFATCVKAFYEILLGEQQVSLTCKKTISLSATKLTTLLYDFLNELVFVFDDEDLLLPIVQSLSIDKHADGTFELFAELAGDKQYAYDLRTEIKNMTYSEMSVIENDAGNWELVVVVDI